MKTPVRDYELLYILSTELGDDNYPSAIEKVNGLVTRYGGEVVNSANTSPWGKRRLAYPIKKQNDGYYVLSNIRLEPKQVVEFERDLRFNEDVLRHLVVSIEEKQLAEK